MLPINQVRSILNEFKANPDEVLAYLKPDAPDCAILFNGSLNEGLGNSRSDIDFQIIYPANCDIQGFPLSKTKDSKTIKPTCTSNATTGWQRDILTVFHKLRTGHRLNIFITNVRILTFLQDQAKLSLDSTLFKINGQTYSGTALAMFFAEHRLLHRFYTGTIIYNDDLVVRLRKKFPFDNFVEYLIYKKFGELNSQIEDLFGVLEKCPKGENETKVFIFQQIFLRLGAILLASVGEANPGEKFLFRLIKRNREKIGINIADRFLDIYKNLYPESTSDPKIGLAFVDESIQSISFRHTNFEKYLKWRKHQPFITGSVFGGPMLSSSK